LLSLLGTFALQFLIGKSPQTTGEKINVTRTAPELPQQKKDITSKHRSICASSDSHMRKTLMLPRIHPLWETKPTRTAGHANALICSDPKAPTLIKHIPCSIVSNQEPALQTGPSPHNVYFAQQIQRDPSRSISQILLPTNNSLHIYRISINKVFLSHKTWTYVLAAGIILAFSAPTKPDNIQCMHHIS
jgi:hypothetical protein